MSDYVVEPTKLITPDPSNPERKVHLPIAIPAESTDWAFQRMKYCIELIERGFTPAEAHERAGINQEERES